MPSSRPPLPRDWRRFPVGAEPAPGGGVHFRVWAPRRQTVAVVLGDAEVATGLTPEAGGYFSGVVRDATAGSTYRFLLDDDVALPDPASRFQPEGPHGPSMVIDPASHRWEHPEWRGIAPARRVLYEMHVGTFTPEGTWTAAQRELPALAELGVTMLEVLPVNDFAGTFGWGYDGVDLYAPTRLYGTPDDFRRFVDSAHGLGIGVILDVVYNHFGPDGCPLREYAEAYFSERHTTDWGDAINFDDALAGPVREFFITNARYWIAEFRLDGLRIDAAQNIYDDSPVHILREITDAVRAEAPARTTYVIAEDEPQDSRLVRPASEGGFGMDALWNDDWHHSATVAATGRDEAYYTDYRGSAAEFVAAAKYGFLYQGQWYKWQQQGRGTPSRDLPPSKFVHYLQNHDQVANSFRGQRLHELASARELRALTALLLLGPQTPMLFQGQEFAASSPFLFFADHKPELMELVRTGRAEFLGQFASLRSPQVRALFIDPGDPRTFARCKLDHGERDRHGPIFALHRDLLALRRDDAVLSSPDEATIDGAVIARAAFVLRLGRGREERLLLVNLGEPLVLTRVPEPLLAPPARMEWHLRWSSEDPAYGGLGMPELAPSMEGWSFPGGCAVLFEAVARDDES
ncbi:MAG TPA: malto-oligosyltrehalose trehalohydrolase [Gemmatimonadaceae bacterium]|nr:malto-oligosyltrehalose trehalohydrolase [Gemmatimonadaceae bacterium]